MPTFSRLALASLLVSASASPAFAQSAAPAPAPSTETADVAREIAAMRAEMARMAARIDTLEAELATAKGEAAEAHETAGKAVALAQEAHEEPATSIAWKGAPKIEGKGGWSFKPRGRIQADAGFTSVPDATGREGGFGSELRRARLGVEGDIPGGFGYKFEVDFAGNEVEVADAVVTYAKGGFEAKAGQHNNYQSLEELTSSRFTSFMERAAFTDAFGFERRLGVSGQYAVGNLLVQGGLFGDNISDLPNRNWGADGRVVLMPKVGSAQLHLGGSLHYAEIDEPAGTARYRQRPFVHFTSDRFIDTGVIAAKSETGYGLEAAAIAGPFHVASEGYWQHVDRSTQGPDPTFFGGYAEVGYFLTRGDTRGYKGGVFDRVKPHRPVDEGGIGAIQVNLRYDYLDLTDAGIVGGTQNGYAVSLIWTPTDYTRVMLNYGKMRYSDAAITGAGGDTSYDVDAFGVRAQVDF